MLHSNSLSANCEDTFVVRNVKELSEPNKCKFWGALFQNNWWNLLNFEDYAGHTVEDVSYSGHVLVHWSILNDAWPKLIGEELYFTFGFWSEISDRKEIRRGFEVCFRDWYHLEFFLCTSFCTNSFLRASVVAELFAYHLSFMAPYKS